MKKKFLALLLILLMAAFGFWILKTLFMPPAKLLKIAQQGQTFILEEKSFKTLDGEEEIIRIEAKKINRKMAHLIIKKGENNLADKELIVGEKLQFNYLGTPYHIELLKIEAKLLGREKAEFRLKQN